MPSERYIPDSEEQFRNWEEAREAKQKLDASRYELIMNTNFFYSWQAYEETERGFITLVGVGELELAEVSFAVEN